MTDYAQTELAVELETLKRAKVKLETEIEKPTKDLRRIRTRHQFLSEAVGQLERFRPRKEKGQMTDNFGFKDALQLLAETNELLQEVQIDLLDASEPTNIFSGNPTFTPEMDVNESKSNVIVNSLNQPRSSNNTLISQQFYPPKLKLKPFTGNITEFPRFIAKVMATINTYPVSKTAKLIYLQEVLEEKPAELIARLPIVDESYDTALEILHERYNKKDYIVAQLYDEIERIPPAKDTDTSLRFTFDEVEQRLNALQAHGEIFNENIHLRNIIFRKFPRDLLYRFDQGPEKKTLLLADFRLKMDNLITLREDISATVLEPDSSISLPQATTAALSVAQNKTASSPERKRKLPVYPCVFCKTVGHYNDQCKKYTTVEERKRQLTDTCFVCLQTGHTQKECQSTKPCFHCKQTKRHASALCPKKFGYQQRRDHGQKNKPTTEQKNAAEKSKNADKSNSNSSSASTAVNLSSVEQGTYLTALLTVQNPENGEEMELRAFLDCGSAATFITDEAARKLKLIGKNPRTVSVDVFATSSSVDLKTTTTSFRITNGKEFSMSINADTTPLISRRIEGFEVEQFRQKYPQYAGLDFANPGNKRNIDLLIGNDYLFDIIQPASKITVQTGLHLLYTKFGWLIVGRSKTRAVSLPVMLATTDALNKLWSLDALGIQHSPEEEEENAIQEFYNNIHFSKAEKRYVISWAWKEFPPELPSNRGLALGRLQSLVRKCQNEKTHLDVLDDIFRQQLASGIIEEIPDDGRHENAHYLPWQIVVKPEKSTKIRPVYDASARTRKHSKSLNDCIYRGKNLISNLAAILLRFRSNKVAVVADFEKAFHKINIAPADRDYLRFFWLKDPKGPVEKENIRLFRFGRVPFGIIESPFLLGATITYHLKKNPNCFTEQFQRDLYVDNLITTVNDTNVAIELYNKSIQLFQECSMNLRLWNSNDTQFINSVQPAHRDTNSTVNILGLRWCTKTDTLTIEVPPNFDFSAAVTLRTILKSMSKFYDPMGWFCPVHVRAKMLLQDIRKQNLSYDDPVPDNINRDWKNVHADLQHARATPINRYIEHITESSVSRQLHVFSDASQRAMGSCIYLRIEKDQQIFTHLLFAKARVAPNKELTIPKLELMALLIAVRSLLFVTKSMQLPTDIPIICWTDSKCVLHWLRTSKILPTFISNRINEIKSTKNVEYRYVPTDLNPADLPSRGAELETVKTSYWFQGPPYLLLTPEQWPTTPISSINGLDIEPEMNHEAAVLITKTTEFKTPFDVKPEKYSSLRKLINITAYCILFLNAFSLFKRQKVFVRFHESPKKNALFLWLLYEQRNHFPSIFTDLQRGKKNPLIHKFNITLKDDLLRCVHRMQFAPVDQEKFLILLPKPTVSHFTKLLILAHHENNFHAGTQYTLNALRRTYWLPQGRKFVFYARKSCSKCARFDARPFRQPDLAPLPSLRLHGVESPFQNSGIDVFGPFYILAQKTIEKRWILLVTCLSIRAIHLEILEDMTAEEYSLAFRRLRARRGPLKLVVCDNAPQFELLRKVLNQLYDEPVEWHPIPALAPFAGGCYERLVAPCKQALLRTFRHHRLNDKQFRTVILEVENCVNNRPLTYVPDELDGAPITPNHILQIQYSAENQSVALKGDTDAHERIIRIWNESREVLDQFWNTWSNEYLLQLRERNEQYKFGKTNSMAQPKVGQLVLLREPNTKRNNWKTGRIIQLQRSHDGEVRAAVLQIPTGRKVVRSVSSLYPLEIDPFLESHEAPLNTDGGSLTNDVKNRSSENPQDDFDEIQSISCEVEETEN